MTRILPAARETLSVTAPFGHGSNRMNPGVPRSPRPEASMANPQKELSEKSQLLKKLIRSSGREGCNALPAPYAGLAITAAAGPGHTLSGRPCRPAPTLRLSMRTWWRVPGPDVGAVKECLEGFQNRGVGGLRQQAESRDAGRSRSIKTRRTRGMEKVQ